MTSSHYYKLLICAVGIYASFLTWALVQEPLTTRVWPVSNEQFQFPNIIAISQASVAMAIGYIYLSFRKVDYHVFDLIRDHYKQLLMISFTQSTSTPLATYSLKQVDYLTYMLAKSCKMIPVLLVHLLLYRTPIENQKKIVAILVSLGVTIFTIGGSQNKKKSSQRTSGSYYGFILLAASLFMDGVTNATQDKMLKTAGSKKDTKKDQKSNKKITGPHLMFSLNLFIILWNIFYLTLIDRKQMNQALSLLKSDPDILSYLVVYAVCGAIGQCFIFYTLESFGSLQLIMITVTRKMISMLLSIAIFGKTVNYTQWFGIFIVFAGITWEATNKRSASSAQVKPKGDIKKTQ
ncbi:similar to Saccharomyces cerevisiae YPL244C HUT1 Protein with a role in UDP-galactose transport to the Golgi lumen [Maudiozyma barnettii]|uniref:UDP-galactose transporter homolog 1 n=1 Tax=Maudiozyma barnettii TaxID=61262 RepID=A0A8H2ZKP6_9SACH|nr:UDP-galactose transporter HUT1 [Kazachstania barnettii]CAB4255382.1 similar to Saccharomyces cerevisiae YPL244C HUT1 Protein with a role in UDP-galactose transport to the Golgi lumen [Kazachstania barnettii]CAD1783788.1 similar to Saccharomyces cerevisiae YPL244C HUT1 Protein with a role in UDP-galactose transport to the Golgi lumen [Kazachstania barnettii]